MRDIRLVIGIGWIAFWLYWLIAASRAGASRPGEGFRPRLAGLCSVAVLVLLRVSALRSGSLALNSLPAAIVGVVIFAAGLAFAVWARIYLGRNWGMPTTQRVAGELITTGPYRWVRHPIYTGLLFGVVGTALTTSLVGFAAVAVLIGYFTYSARVEERYLATEFVDAYPPYRAATKMFIPFLL